MIVSVITPSFNSEKTIQRTIESVLNQDYQEIEYIIIDNCSEDGTIEIAKKYSDKFVGKRRLRILSEKDSGIYEAMNKGIRMSSGELIGIINSDDWYETDAISTAVLAYHNNTNSVIYGMLKIFKDGKLYQIRQNTHYFISENMFQHPTWFVPKAIYEKNGLFDTSYQIGGDYEFANRLLNNGIKFTRIEKILANFTIGGASSNSNVGAKEWHQIRVKYGHIVESENVKDVKQKTSIVYKIKHKIRRFINAVI